MNYKMTVQYDGSRYSGWQRQGNTDHTIQAKLEKALSGLLGVPVEVSGSGRTDAGVHALGQIASFKTDVPVSCQELLMDLNSVLPKDIAVVRLTTASPRFHARLSAKEKTYRYSVWNSSISNVMERRFLYQLPEPLNLPAMQTAAGYLLGTHDFKGYSTGRTQKTTVRAVTAVDIECSGNRVDIYFTGNGFLYNMVRIMAGTLLEVGLGQRTPESVKIPLETLNRQDAGFTAPPCGLCLMEVMY